MRPALAFHARHGVLFRSVEFERNGALFNVDRDALARVTDDVGAVLRNAFGRIGKVVLAAPLRKLPSGIRLRRVFEIEYGNGSVGHAFFNVVQFEPVGKIKITQQFHLALLIPWF